MTSRATRWLVFEQVVDTPELDDLRALVVSELTTWTGHAPAVSDHATWTQDRA